MYDFETIINRKNIGSVKWDVISEKMGQSGEDIIAMSVADMEFKAAPEITEAIKEKADFGIYGYTAATDAYYEAVRSWMQRRHNWEIQKDWILLASGVVPAFYNAISALTKPGDKVIIQEPVYYPFKSAVVKNQCEIVNNKLLFKNGRYEMDFEDLERKVQDPKVKVMMLCSPHNPIGRVWSIDELKRLGEICLKNNVIIISDEIHFDFIYKPYKHTIFANISKEFEQNSIILTAPSKTFNLAGLQCANVIIPNAELRKKYQAVCEKIAFWGLNYFAYVALEAAYNKSEKWLEELLEVLEQNKQYVKDYIKENIPKLSVIETEGTYLMWIDCRSLGMNKEELEKFMKEKARLFLDEGYLFGEDGTGFERINIACPKIILQKALENIKAAVDSLK